MVGLLATAGLVVISTADAVWSHVELIGSVFVHNVYCVVTLCSSNSNYLQWI